MIDDDVNIQYGAIPTVPIFKGTAGQQVYEALLKYQDLPEAMVCAETNRVISYKTLLVTTSNLASALQINGFSKDDGIAVYSHNILEYLYPIIASWYLGIAATPINPEYIRHELLHVVNLSKPVIIFCCMKTLPNVKELLQKVEYIKKVIVMDLKTEIDGVESLHSFISASSERLKNERRFEPISFDTQQLALIMCSSGTTGLPKGVMVTHENMVYRFAQSREDEFMFVQNPTESVLSFMPRFHAVGLTNSIESLLMGNRSIIMKRFEPNTFCRCIQDYRIKGLRVPPPVIVFLAKSAVCDQYDLSSLEDILCGAAPLSKVVEYGVKERFGRKLNVRQGYGLTESTVGVILNPRSKSKVGSSGKVIPHVAVKVVDVKDHSSLEANKPGELWIRGSVITKGYIGDHAATSKAFLSNGWLRTGDIGYYDKDGYFYIIDRLKELIKYKGFQVAPAELEGILLKHPKISAAGVVGIPDERAGELPTAFVSIKEGEQLSEREVLEYVNNQVSPQKQLRGGVHFLAEIPKSPSGKILRRKLRKLIEHKFSKL